MRRTFGRLLIRVLWPTKNWESATRWWQLLNGIPLLVALLLLAGAWYGTLSVPWFALMWFVGFLVLTLLAAFRLLAEKEERERRRPLRVASVSVDADWRGLVVVNDNDFAVRGAYVRAATSEPPLIPRGFRFTWSTHTTDWATRSADIGPHDEAILDMVSFTVNRAIPSKPVPGGPAGTVMRARILQPDNNEHASSTAYTFHNDMAIRLELGSDVTAIPHGGCTVLIQYETVAVQLEPSAPPPTATP